MSRVYYIAGKYQGCTYLRCLLPMWENGWNGNVISISNRQKDKSIVGEELKSADIVVFHRPESVEHHKLAYLLKQMGKKIVFDNDDTWELDKESPFYGLDETGKEQSQKLINDLVHNFITNSDLVTTTTETLADEYRKFNKNVVILPNCVNPSDWEKPQRNETDVVRIGVVGSTAYTQDLSLITKELLELDKRKDVQFVIFGLQSEEKRKENPLVSKVYKKEYELIDKLKNKEHVGWVDMKDYSKTLNRLKLDIMLIPRKECYFNKCKSNVKFLEAAMCEVPCIVSSFDNAPYEEITEDIGIKIKNGDSWKEAINKLIDNKELRRKMGANAKEYVLNKYDIKNNAKLWKDAYNKII